MTALALPTAPLPKSATARPIVFGGWQTPTLGGPDQFLQRLGNRWALDVVTDNLKPEPDGRNWTSILRQAWLSGATVVYPWPQPGLAIGVPGTPLVAGGAQAGSSLALREYTPNSFIQAGRFFSLISGGRRYMHSLARDTVVANDGTVAVPLCEMLRVVPADGDVVEFAQPMIEGKVVGNTRQWTMIPARVQSLQFSIEEVA